jgi:hypothetical protein
MIDFRHRDNEIPDDKDYPVFCISNLKNRCMAVTATGVSVDNEESLDITSRGMDAQVFFDDFPYWVPVAELYKEIAP